MKTENDRPLFRRTQASLVLIAGAVAACVLVAGLASLMWFEHRSRLPEDLVLRQVIRGPYQHIIIEQGEVESADNVEVHCEVRARAGGGLATASSTSIVDVVPEGAWVKAGDWLITFDSSALEQEQRTQRIAVNARESAMIQAKAAYDKAVIARTEYVEGLFREQETTIQNAIALAQQQLRKTELSRDSSKRLAAKGVVTRLQLEGVQFRVRAAENDLDLNKRKLTVLNEYARPKMLTQLDSDIKATEVTYKNESASYHEELSKLKDIEDQIARCRVVAPAAGQVVYANLADHHGRSEFVVEAGAPVRERQVLIHLPNPRNMQVKVEINESRINLVRPGQPATIGVEAIAGLAVRGEVTHVNKFAEPSNFWDSNNKKYVALIRILDPPPQLRVGLTAEVKIEVAQGRDALQIPIQGVCEYEGRTLCLVKGVDGWEPREVVIGSVSDTMVAVDELRSTAIRAGDTILLHPRRHLEALPVHSPAKTSLPASPTARPTT